jgi:hypothetical protein
MAIVSANGAATPLSPNYLINSAFEIWQRGNSIAVPANTFLWTSDRWSSFFGVGVVGTVTKASSGVTESPSALKMQRNSGNTGTSPIALQQTIESITATPLAGKTLTFSYWAKAGANYSQGPLGIVVIQGTGNDEGTGGVIGQNWTGHSRTTVGTVTLSTVMTRYTHTFTLNQSTTEFAIQLLTTPTGTAGADDSFTVTGAQLEVGSIATPFRRNSPNIQAELATCQRYFWSPTAEANGYMPIATCYGVTTTTGYAIFEFPVSMRVKPTFSVDSVSNFGLGFANTNYGLSSLVQNMDGTSTKRTLVSYVPSSSLASATQITMLYRVAGAGLTGSIGFTAEI